MKTHLLKSFIVVWFCFLITNTAGIYAANISFDPAVTFDAGSGTKAVEFFDLNNDGNLDMVTANTYAGNVGIHLGDGLGGFGDMSTFGVGTFPMHLAFADLNEDGDIDIITANYLDASLSVLFGNGDGTFQPAADRSLKNNPLDYSEIGDGPTFLAVGDLNKDGHLDVVSAIFDDGVIAVLFGDGSGNLTAPTFYTTSSGPIAVAIADLNNDDKLDICVVCTSYALIQVFEGDGLGDFEEQANITVGGHPRLFAVQDLNGDGDLDLAIASYDDNRVYVVEGNGDGTFELPVGYAVGNSPFGIAVADLNGDGFPDIAVTNSLDYDVSVILNDGIGGFGPATDFPVGAQPIYLAIADLNGDIKPDIAVANFDDSTVSILFNTSSFFSEEQIVAIQEFFDEAVNGGTLNGAGSGSSADGRLGALRNMLEEAALLINAGDIAGACQQITDAYKRTDGQPKPPDFVQGSDAIELALMLLDLLDDLKCSP